jgi:hypothetical protein
LNSEYIFVRLSSRSAKDAPLVHFGFRDLFDKELKEIEQIERSLEEEGRLFTSEENRR